MDPGPLALVDTRVPAAWIDDNGHMTEHRYLQLFGETTDALLRLIGVDMDYVGGGHSYYTVETHLRHLGEAKLGEALRTTCQILSADEKRLHVFHRILNGEREIATAEQMLLHVDSEAGRATRRPRRSWRGCARSLRRMRGWSGLTAPGGASGGGGRDGVIQGSSA